MLRRVVYALVFLGLVAEVKGEVYSGKWETIMAPVGTILMTPLPIKFPLWDILVFGLVFFGSRGGGPASRARVLTRTMWLALITTAVLWLWGVARGGNVQQTLWQTHGFVMMFVMGFMMIGCLRTPKDFVGVGKAVFFAALYRSTTCILFAQLIVPGLPERPATMTTHSDTALFVTGIILVVSWAVETRSTKSILITALSVPYILVAIQLNNRRLAYVSLLAGLFLIYLMLPKGKIRRRINLAGLVAAPLLAAYIAIGWGRTEGIFKPVGSLSTMLGKHEDASSETRNIENYNLLVTLKKNPILGTGWGHEYDEVSVAYSIKDIFPQYRYIPHNSALGLLAFTGLLGFAGVWLVFPVSGFLSARTYRFSKSPIERAAAMTALTEVVVFANQAWGDMGLGSVTTGILMAAAMGVAGRLSITSGAWTEVAKKPKKRPAQAPTPPAAAPTAAPPPVTPAADR